MYKTITLFLLHAAYTEALCPDVKTADNLNMTAFATGLWSTLARYPSHYETAVECLTLKYSLNGNIFKIESVDVPEDAHNFFDGLGIVQADGKILFNVSTGYPRQTVQITLTVLFADIEKYAVVYDCIHDGDNNTQDSVWIIGRNTVLSDADTARLYAFMKTTKIIDISKLVWIKYSDEICKQH